MAWRMAHSCFLIVMKAHNEDAGSVGIHSHDQSNPMGSVWSRGSEKMLGSNTSAVKWDMNLTKFPPFRCSDMLITLRLQASGEGLQVLLLFSELFIFIDFPVQQSYHCRVRVSFPTHKLKHNLRQFSCRDE